MDLLNVVEIVGALTGLLAGVGALILNLATARNAAKNTDVQAMKVKQDLDKQQADKHAREDAEEFKWLTEQMSLRGLEIERLEKTLDRRRTEIEDLQAKYNQVVSELGQFRGENIQLRVELEGVRSENLRLRHGHDGDQARITQLEKQVEDLTAENGRMSSALRSAGIAVPPKPKTGPLTSAPAVPSG